ncbi:MAG: type II secretion system inner membrane protein GspF [bacterium]
MPTYQYTAMDEGGQEVTGTLEAPNEDAVISQLKDQGYRPVDIKEKTESILSQIPLLGSSPADPEEIAVFTRQMATLLDAGLPLLRAVNVLEDQVENEEFKAILQKISQDIQGGSSFSEALAAHPGVFDDLYVNMVKAGEAGGVLDEVLDRLAEFAEKRQELKAKIKSATMYPAIMGIIAILVVVFLLVFVLPTFTSLFREMDVDLPLPTQIVIGISNFIQGFWWLVLIGLAGLYMAYLWWYETDNGELFIDRMKLNIPVFGPLFKKVQVARFARTLATLINSGVPILEAIDIVQDTIGNRVISDTMDEVHDSISEGETISEPLHESGVFPPMVTHMISVGEETGNLDEMLNRVADTYEVQVDEMVDGLSSMLEPILITFMGVTIGVIVMAMFLPMFQLVNVVG